MPDEQESSDRIDSLRNSIQGAIDRSVLEWDLSYAEIVGVLDIMKFDLMMSLWSDFGDDDEEE